MTLYDQIHDECCCDCPTKTIREMCHCYNMCARYREEYDEIEAERTEQDDG